MIGYIIAIIVVLLYLLYTTRIRETYQPSMIDNRLYKVLYKFNDYQEAANFLAKINRVNIAIIEYITRKYSRPGTHGYKMAQRLNNRYNPDSLIENDPPDKYTTSYTEDKGSVLALCLREKISGENKFEDFNSLIFVSVHELSHIASEGYGHEDEFWMNFKFLLNEAVASGLYDNIDYSKYPINYCGLDVKYNPLFDGSLPLLK